MTVITTVDTTDATCPPAVRRAPRGRGPDGPSRLRRLPLPELHPPRLPADDGCPGQVSLDLRDAGDGAGGSPCRVDLAAEAAAEVVEPRRWAAQFVHAAAEVAAGFRAPGQLSRWTSRTVQQAVERRHALAVRQGAGTSTSVQVRAVHLSRPRPGVVEVAAVVATGARLRAVALQMRDGGGRWRVTALEFG